MSLTWTRGKRDQTYGGAGGDYTVTQTTHTTTLTTGATVVLTKVDDVYFLDVDGHRGNGNWPFATLRAGKEYVQRVEDSLALRKA